MTNKPGPMLSALTSEWLARGWSVEDLGAFRMAITAPTKTTDFSGFLPATIAGPIFEQAAQMSVVQQLVRQVPLGANGVSVPVVTGRPVANWVAEGGQKPATNGSMTLKSLTPKKLSAILVVSSEVVRADPGGYVAGARGQLAEAFAVAFDLAALHNLGGGGTGTGPFATYIDQTTKANELGANSQANGGIYKDLVDAAAEIISDTDATGRRYRVTGFALDSQMEMRLRGAVDSTGRPIWVDLPTNAEANALTMRGNLLNRRSFIGDGIANPANTIMGYAGDWSRAAWGVVGGIDYKVSTEATVTINGTLTSLFENNLVAILAEAEYGFLVDDADAFIQLRNDSGS
jgi:HK97 family phage major capsid protein